MIVFMAGNPAHTTKIGKADAYRDPSAFAVLRTTLDEVFSDHRFFVRKLLSPCRIAQCVLQKILQGERDIDCLKTSIFEEIDSDCALASTTNPESSRAFPAKQELTMSTVLHTSSAKTLVTRQATGSLRERWIIVFFVSAMFLIGAFANPRAEVGPADPLQLLMVF